MVDLGGTSFAERLHQAMAHAQVGIPALADHLQVSTNAIKKLLVGTSGAMNAANNSKTAKFLGVNPDWLATGEGEMLAAVWPFVRVTREQLAALEEVDRLLVEGQLLQALHDLRPHKKDQMPPGVALIPERRQQTARQRTGGIKGLGQQRRRAADKKSAKGG